MKNAKPGVHPDQRFIEGMLTNDLVLMREIYSKYAERIAGLVMHNKGSRQDAKDIFQEGLTAIYQQACRGDFVLTCPFEAYLYIICRRLWFNELKKRKRKEVTIQDLPLYKDTEDAFQLAEERAEVMARDQLFWEQFHALGEKCQELLKNSWTGMSMEQVAEIMDISYGYARKKKSTCVKRLMELVRKSSAFIGIKTGNNG